MIKDWKMMLTERNVGRTDQKVRLILGIALAFLYLAGIGGVLVLIASAILIVTGARRTCPFYLMTGTNTVTKPTIPVDTENRPLN